MANDKPRGSFCGRTCREFLSTMGGGSLALTGSLARDGLAARRSRRTACPRSAEPARAEARDAMAKAKSVIFLFIRQ